MGRIIEERLEQFHRRAIEQACSAGLCAYVLGEDGRVMRFRPDGTQELIVFGATSGMLAQKRRRRQVVNRHCVSDAASAIEFQMAPIGA